MKAGAVDRRFYRSRYDARRTVETFSTRLQEEIDLDALSGELVAVVSGAPRGLSRAPPNGNARLRA